MRANKPSTLDKKIEKLKTKKDKEKEEEEEEEDDDEEDEEESNEGDDMEPQEKTKKAKVKEPIEKSAQKKEDTKGTETTAVNENKIKVQSKIHTGVYRYKVVSNQKQETKDTPSTTSTTTGGVLEVFLV